MLSVATKTKKLHMIGNAHLDPVWLWQWQEGFHEVKATFRSALDRIREYPDFVFVSSSAAYYEWLEQSDPAMFCEVQQRVAEGRWNLVGGWWVQPDCNLPSGESFVRQALYAQHYFQKKFGVTAKVGYNVDSFGHHGNLPQILKKSGMDYYLFMRPSPHEKGLPGRLFWWESDDCSRVLTCRIPYEYTSYGPDLEKHIRRCADELRLPQTEMMCFYGVGNHGGGPTRDNIDMIHRLQADENAPELVFSTPEQFFAEAEQLGNQLPVVHDDLQHHASGCYAAHSGVKRWNRKAENLLLSAEKLSALARQLTGQPYPTDLELAWKNVLFNQFHDILAGTSIPAAYEDARDQYGEALSIAGRAQNLAVQALAWQIHSPQNEGWSPVVVFNPLTWPVRSYVDFEASGTHQYESMRDDSGKPVNVQRVQSSATAKGKFALGFLADLPALGYATYWVRPETSNGHSPAIQADDTSIETETYCLEINPETGCIRSLRNKRRQYEVFMGEAAKPVVLDDPSDTWSHNVFRYDKVLGQFKPRRVRLVEYGMVKATIRVESEWGLSRLIQDFTMYAGQDGVDVKVTLDWREERQMLKLRFPLQMIQMKPVYEIPYGTILRTANGEEEPGQSWIDVSGVSRDTGDDYGLSILNDAKYSYDVNIRDIGLTVVRSPIYAHHMPIEPDEDTNYPYMDQGLQEFRYTLLPHAGSWEEAGTVRRAAELNQRPVVLQGTFHEDGQLPQRADGISVEPANVMVTVVKQAEDGEDLIVRAYETSKTAARATIHLTAWNRTFTADFGPAEIKTFRVPHDEAQPVVETNLLEWTE